MKKEPKPKSKRSFLGELLFRLLYTMGFGLMWLLSKLFFAFRVRRDPAWHKLDGPILILANHQSFLDPLLGIVAMGLRPARMVVGQFLFHSPIRPLLQYMQTIPIQQFKVDIRAVREMTRALRNNERVFIYPEGQRSIDGSSLSFSPDILNFAKRNRASVVTLKLSGAYLAWPRWIKGPFRLGPVRAEIKLLCRPEDLQREGTEPYVEKLCAELNQDEHTWAREKRRRYLSFRKVPGLHLILHRCPSCGCAESLTSSWKQLICSSCGVRYSFRTDLSFIKYNSEGAEVEAEFLDIADWHAWQIEEERKLLVLNPDSEAAVHDCGWKLLELKSGKILEEGRGHYRVNVNAGSLLLDREEREQLSLSLSGKRGVMFNQGEYIQITMAEGLLRIYPDNPYQVIRLVDTLLIRS
ncbi:MAG: lysophospholipid acyltransferase family protein [Eubacteriales bacterium]|nr:lysophospholipid acyltransferase family protein [Eubacteriales bacterium]